MKKYYEILEVNPKASIEVIEKAYKVLAKKYYPDAYEGEEKIYAEQKLRDINEAYKILSDEFLREQYDGELRKEIIEERIFKEKKKKSNKQNHHIFYEKKKENSDITKKKEKSNIGTYKGLLEVTNEVFKNRPKIKLKDLKKEDYIAICLTVVTMIIILVVMWFIPFTNGFIRSMLPFLK